MRNSAAMITPIRFASWAIAMVLVAFAPAMAQQPRLPQFMLAQPPLDPAAAFATPYGQKLVDALAAALIKDIYHVCAQGEGIEPASLRARGEALLIGHATARFARMLALIDTDKADAAFARLASRDGLAEWRRLQGDGRVRAFIAELRAFDAQQLVDETTELFDRYVLEAKLRLDPISAAVAGDDSITAERDAIEAKAVAAYEAARGSTGDDTLRRYIELADHGADALNESADMARMSALGPLQWFAGLDKDLRALCIGYR
jgi:aminopeptidase N